MTHFLNKAVPVEDIIASSLIPSPSFLVLECAGSKKVGPGIHSLRHVLQKSYESRL